MSSGELVAVKLHREKTETKGADAREPVVIGVIHWKKLEPRAPMGSRILGLKNIGK